MRAMYMVLFIITRSWAVWASACAGNTPIRPWMVEQVCVCTKKEKRLLRIGCFAHGGWSWRVSQWECLFVFVSRDPLSFVLEMVRPLCHVTNFCEVHGSNHCWSSLFLLIINVSGKVLRELPTSGLPGEYSPKHIWEFPWDLRETPWWVPRESLQTPYKLPRKW
jgi:hypothetical protein